MRTGLVTLFPIVFALACAGGSDSAQVAEKAANDPATVRQAIDQVNADFVAGFKAGDVAKLVAYYDADATVMPNGMPAAHGSAEIQKTLGEFLGAYTITDFQLTTTDVTVKEDMAIETGTSRMVIQPKQGGGQATTDVGKYVVVWKKQADGSWKLWRDIFNSDAAPAPPK